MHTLWDNCCTRFEDTQFECGLRPLRPFGPGTLVARSSNVARGSKRTRFAASRLSLPNQPKDNVTPMHTLWDNCCTRFEDTQFECGLRLLRPFGPVRMSHAVRGHAVRMWPSAPKALRACTHVARGSNDARGSNVFYLTNQKIMSHIRIHFGTIVARGSRTRSSNVAFGP